MKLSKWKIAAMAIATAMIANSAMRADDVASANNSDATESINESMGALTGKMSALESKVNSLVEMHGFAEIDTFYDDTQSFTETVGDGGVKPNNQLTGFQGETQMSPRNTRLDALSQGSVNGWKMKGYVEGDFLGFEGSGPAYGPTGAGTNDAGLNNEYKFYTQPTFRLRHAYLDAQNPGSGFEFLAGQWWSLYGWNMDYVLSTVSLAPVMGTLYERTPQLRLQENLGDNKTWALQIAVDAEKPEQAQSEAPNVNEGIRFSLPGWTGRFCPATGASAAKPFSIGISETNSRYDWMTISQTAATSTSGSTTNPGTTDSETDNNLWASAFAVDTLIPVVPSDADGFSVVLLGEATQGAGDADGFNGGGFTGLGQLNPITGSFSGSTAPVNYIQSDVDPDNIGVDANGAVDLVDIASWNAQMQISLPRSIGSIVTLGYSSIFSDNIQTMVNTPSYNATKVFNGDQSVFANIMQDLGPNMRIALEYDIFSTDYLASTAANSAPYLAIDHRVQLSSYYRF